MDALLILRLCRSTPSLTVRTDPGPEGRRSGSSLERPARVEGAPSFGGHRRRDCGCWRSQRLLLAL